MEQRSLKTRVYRCWKKLYWIFRKLQRKYTGKYTGYQQGYERKILDYDESNLAIQQMINNGKPCMIARYGATELKTMVKYEHPSIKTWNKEQRLEKMKIKSGFFPATNELMYRFVELMQESTKCVDLIGLWYQPMEDYMLKVYGNNPILATLEGLEPWNSNNPWTKSLKGKNVLVIHPFEKTIISQYARREELFPGTEILPEFNLLTIKAVQTLTGQEDSRFIDWFEALDYMYEKALGMDFDIALIGCGAYGFPLAAKLKAAGKQAVHLGGALQILFGIKGKRWDNAPNVSMLYNDCWVRPDETEKVSKMELTENSCYW